MRRSIQWRDDDHEDKMEESIIKMYFVGGANMPLRQSDVALFYNDVQMGHQLLLIPPRHIKRQRRKVGCSIHAEAIVVAQSAP